MRTLAMLAIVIMPLLACTGKPDGEKEKPAREDAAVHETEEAILGEGDSLNVAVQDTAGNPIEGARLEGIALGSSLSPPAFYTNEQGLVRVPLENAELFMEASAPGFALSDKVHEVKNGHIFVLERAVWVELMIPDHIKLPEPPLFLSVSLGQLLESKGGSRSGRTVGKDARGDVHDVIFHFGPSRAVTFAVPGSGQYEVQWWVSRRDAKRGGSVSHSGFGIPPYQVIKIEEDVARASFGIEPPEKEYEEKFRGTRSRVTMAPFHGDSSADQRTKDGMVSPRVAASVTAVRY